MNVLSWLFRIARFALRVVEVGILSFLRSVRWLWDRLV